VTITTVEHNEVLSVTDNSIDIN